MVLKPIPINQSIADWNMWLTEKANQPWFSYIEVTTVDNFESIPSNSKEDMSASERFKNAYEFAVKSADDKVGGIIKHLKTLNYWQTPLLSSLPTMAVSLTKPIPIAGAQTVTTVVTNCRCLW